MKAHESTVVVVTCLLLPDRTVTSFEDVLRNPHDFFVPYHDADRVMQIRDGYEEGRLHGYIDIRCWDLPILDASYYDYIDQLWGYLL